MNPKTLRRLSALVWLALMLVTASLAAPTTNAAGPPKGAHTFHTREWYANARAGRLGNFQPFSPTDNLPPGSGPTMHTMQAFLIFWDPNNNIPSTFKNLLARYFQDIGGTPFYNIVTQYYDTVGGSKTFIQNVVTYGGSWTDTTNAYPHAGSASDPIFDSDIQAEVDRAISANSWPTGLSNMFFVFTEKGIESCMTSGKTSCTLNVTGSNSNNAYCAYHNFFNSGANERIYANMPYVATWTGSPGCNNTNGQPNNFDADLEISTTSHEQFEAMTDPEPNSNWTDANCAGNVVCGEIGDKCAYVWGAANSDSSNLTLHGNPYNVQEEWSNAAFNGTANSGCVEDYQPANVSITKTGPSSVSAGTSLLYNISVINNGAPTAETPKFSDVLPSFLKFQALTAPAGWNCTTPPVGSNGTVTCNKTNGYMNNGETANFGITTLVPANTPNGTTLNNTGRMDWDTKYTNKLNSTSSTSALVITSADLVVNKSATTDPVIAGTNETYNLTVTNNGPSDAQNVTLTDATPANTTFVSFAQNTGSAFTCTTPPSGGTGTVSCTLATLAAGASAAFSFVVHVSPSAPDGSTLSNTASVSSSTTDPNLSNNAKTITTGVIARADLSITKSQVSNLVIADINETYNLTVKNNGPSDAQNVTLTDATPANTTFVSFAQNTGPAFTCTTPPSGGTGNVSCTLATLPAGASATFTLVVRVSPVDVNSISNTASVAARTIDPNPGNNSATVTAVVSVRLYKQNVLTDLTTLRGSVTDKQDGKKLDDAIKHLFNSLDPSLWVDGNTLVAKGGEKVFSEEKDAVVKLTDLIKNNSSGISAGLQGFVNRLIAADRALADIAITQAINAGGGANQIAQAQKELAQGNSDASAGKYIVAIEHYRNAWQHAQQAMKK